MRKLATLTAAALLWGTATFASGYADVIVQAFETAGYTNVTVTKAQRLWLVTAEMNGTVQQFTVDPSTGRSSRSNDDGPGHDLNDDHGEDGPGHDLNDDHGEDGPGHDLNDDHGHDGADHDEGDDHGGRSRGHDDDHGSDDHGRHGSDHD